MRLPFVACLGKITVNLNGRLQPMSIKHSAIPQSTSTNLHRLEQQYGSLMTASEVMHELKFSSLAAMRMARRRGSLALKAVKLPGRREHLFRTNDVIALLTDWLEHCEEEAPM